MTARRAFLASILVITLPLTILAAPAKSKPKVQEETDQPTAVVLCYHVVEGPSGTRFEISREMFRQHLRYLEMTGYNVIPLQHLHEYMTGKRASLPKNAIVITIDDGWRSAYTEAWPELQKFKFPFTLFIYPNIVGKTPIALSWKQVREMADAGVDIQSHSLSHPYLSRRKHRSMDDETYAEWLRKELRESRKIIEKQTGRAVKFIAYPYGDFDAMVAKQAAAAGYDGAFTCVFGKVRRDADRYRINRVVIDKKMDFADFRHYLGAKPMQLADMTPAPTRTPVDPAITTVSAKIPSFKSLDPQTVGMALLSAANALPFSYDAKDGSISIAIRDAISSLGRHHRAIVWGIDRKTGKRVEGSWTFRLPDPSPAASPAAAPATAPAAVGASMVGGMGGGGGR